MLICLASVLLSFTFESGNGRWDLRKVMICNVYCLVYFGELLQKTIALGLQFSLVPADGSLSVIQGLDLITD